MQTFNKLIPLFFLYACLTACGTASSETTSTQEPKTTDQESFHKAKVILAPTKNNNVRGQVTFTVVADGVRIVADVSGLKPGKHGFHVHEKGNCSAHDASSAGGHFNPTDTKHGGPDSKERHIGDLGNLEADDNGIAHYDRVDKLVKLSGPHSVVGKSIVVHADPDDFVSQPAGNAGNRIACGVIEGEK